MKEKIEVVEGTAVPTYKVKRGRVRPNLTGDYDETRDYVTLEGVTLNGQSYCAIHDVKKGISPESEEGKKHWALMAARGESLYEAFKRLYNYAGTEDEFYAEWETCKAGLDQKITEASKAIEATNEAAKKAEQAAGTAEAAAGTANTKAARAETAASNADRAAGWANTVAGSANSAAGKAMAAKSEAEKAAIAANTAAGVAMEAKSETDKATTAANTAAGRAETATITANTAAEKATTAKDETDKATAAANTAAGKANTAAGSAEKATTAANTAAEKATAAKGEADKATAAANTAAGKANTAAETIDGKINPVVENDKKQDTEITNQASQQETAEKITAAALLENVNDIAGLKSILLTILNGSAYLSSVLTRKIQIDGADLVIKSDTTPAGSPDFVGQFYIDQAAKIAYIAVGNESVSDWKPINVA